MSNKNEQIIITCNYMKRSKQSQLGAKKKKKPDMKEYILQGSINIKSKRGQVNLCC